MHNLHYSRDEGWLRRGWIRAARSSCRAFVLILVLSASYWGAAHIAECRRLRQLQIECAKAQPGFDVPMYEELAADVPTGITGPHRMLDVGLSRIYIRQIPEWDAAIPQLLGSRFEMAARRADAYVGEIATEAGHRYFLEIGVYWTPDARSIIEEAGVSRLEEPSHYVGARVYSVGSYWRRPHVVTRKVFSIRNASPTTSADITLTSSPAAQLLVSSNQGERTLTFGAGRIDRHTYACIPYQINGVRGSMVFSVEGSRPLVRLELR